MVFLYILSTIRNLRSNRIAMYETCLIIVLRINYNQNVELVRGYPGVLETFHLVKRRVADFSLVNSKHKAPSQLISALASPYKRVLVIWT